MKLSLLVVGVALCALPAHAYGDPSGGAIFQILMPTLAAIWAMWMILATRIRKAVAAVYRKLRGFEAEEAAD